MCAAGRLSKDHAQAQRWYGWAVKQDHPHALLHMGELRFLDGDVHAARQWFRKAHGQHWDAGTHCRDA